MKNTAFCILTRGRSDRQITLKNLPDAIKQQTLLIVDEDEYAEHKQYKKEVRQVLPMPKVWEGHKFNGNFSDKKEWTANTIAERYLFFIDDDLNFNVRKNGKLVVAEEEDKLEMFEILFDWLHDEKIAHVALSPREGNNHVEEDYTECSRAMRVCGFDLNVIEKERIKFNRTILMADFDVTLALLRLGYKNRILYSHANGQRKSNDDGGCSLYRTPETMTLAAKTLASLHPGIVKVEMKKTEKPWAGFDTNIRTDVTVSWKKAFGMNSATKGNIKNFF